MTGVSDDFSGLRSNCADLVYGVLNAGGIKTTRPTFSVAIPNDILDSDGSRVNRNQVPTQKISPPGWTPNTFKHGYW
jgi:hypothetical protein